MAVFRFGNRSVLILHSLLRFSEFRVAKGVVFSPFSLGPLPGWSDGCIEEVVRVALRARPSLGIVDCVGNLRLVGSWGARDQLPLSLGHFASPAAGLGGLVAQQRRRGPPPPSRSSGRRLEWASTRIPLSPSAPRRPWRLLSSGSLVRPKLPRCPQVTSRRTQTRVLRTCG